LLSEQPPNKKPGGIDKSMIGAPTDFRHIEGAKIGASGRMEQVKGKFTLSYESTGKNVPN